MWDVVSWLIPILLIDMLPVTFDANGVDTEGVVAFCNLST